MCEKSNKLWIEAQDLLIEQLKLQQENAELNIKLNRRMLKNVKDTIKHEEKLLKQFLNCYLQIKE